MALIFILLALSALANACWAQPPLCDADGPYSGFVDEPIQFDGTGSIAFPPHVIVLYEWNFGDGESGSGPTPTHTYSSAGTFTVRLTVTDDDQDQSVCLSAAQVTTPTPVEPSTWGRIKSTYRD